MHTETICRNSRSLRHSAHRLASVAALASCFIANFACAVTLNPRGVGQALIYPYYTVNKNQDTLVSITNASDVGKAVQVRFREGYNGRDALSFVVFLGAHDAWTAAVSQSSEDEGARINTSDTSCTRSPIPPDGVNFRSADYDGTGIDPADGGPTGISRTREGSIEFIVGGNIKPGSPTDLAIEHPVSGGPPPCGGDFSNFVDDLEDPTGGVFGSAAIIDVGQGTFYAYNADALEGLSDDVMFVSGLPYPGPDLSGASNNEGVHGVARAFITTNDGHQIGVDYARGIDAVSAAFMADSLYNEYIVSDSLGANTDWVVTFPTKHFYVDSLYGAVPAAPFQNAFAAPGAANVEVSGSVFDREQKVVGFGDCGNAQCAPAVLPFEVNVIGIGHLNPDFTSPVLGSTLSTFNAFFMPAAGGAGNAVLQFSTLEEMHTLAGGTDAQYGNSLVLHGLPAAGFMVYNVVNANAEPGILANYSGAFPHRASVACEGFFFGCQPH